MLDKRRVVSIAVAIIVAAVTWLLLPGLPGETRAAAAVTVLVGILWFTEGLPLWVTAMTVPALLVTLVGISPTSAFTPFFDPINALMLGGFVLGVAINTHGLDKRIVNAFIGVTGRGAESFLLGLMCVTAFLSFWISNTASAALLMPIGLMVLNTNGIAKGSNYAKATVLGIGYAATIGGVGTLIGTPPNLIAVNWLAESGITIDFLQWMKFAIPLVIFMIPAAWFSLTRMYKPEVDELEPPNIEREIMSIEQKAVLATFIVTAMLWLTEPFHGIHNSVVAMLPVVALFGTGLLGKDDIREIGWDVLMLIGGGLALGRALVTTGLDKLIANEVAEMLAGYDTFLLFFLLGVFAIAFTAFVANTGAAAILIPVMIPVAETLGISPLAMALVIGIVVSFDFIVPVGTPPSAIAYGTGYIRVRDMIKAGLLLSILGALATAIVAVLWWTI